MDAQIYQFQRRQQATWPNGDGFVDVVSGAMRFSACYVGAMFSFHVAMVRLACDAIVQSGEVMR